MDLVKAVQHYVDKMINEVPGMKALLLDTDTVNDNFSIIFFPGCHQHHAPCII